MDKRWIDHFGFRFDPFEYDEASRDPHLNRYLIGHDAFSAAWGETPAAIFSPPGGGKTALRIYAARACWTGGGGYQPFPIHYHLPHYFADSNFSTLEDHLQRIVHSSANALFLAFAYYPLILLRTSTSLQTHLVQFVAAWIPKLDYYLAVLRENRQPDIVAAQLDRSYVLHQSPDASLLNLVCEIFEKHLGVEKLPISSSIHTVFERVMRWITRDLGFRSVYVLLDGVDGFPELASSPGFAAQSLVQLFAKAPEWTASNIFLKGFLPLEIRPHLQKHFEKQWATLDQVKLKWDAAMLADMLRRRVYAATEGAFASLSAVSALPAGQDLELELARAVNPLPREALTLVRQVLFEYESRWGRKPTAAKQIQIEDIENAIAWYRSDQAHITKELDSVAQG
ncbi:MAG: hypothetical protein AB1509_05660 [Chloroflexota bacterium]